MQKCDFSIVALQLRHGCSPVNLLHIFRTPFTKNTSGGLLLAILNSIYRTISTDRSSECSLWQTLKILLNQSIDVKQS